MAGVITDTPDEHPLRQNRPFPDAGGAFAHRGDGMAGGNGGFPVERDAPFSRGVVQEGGGVVIRGGGVLQGPDGVVLPAAGVVPAARGVP